jgi:hypothetical protein
MVVWSTLPGLLSSGPAHAFAGDLDAVCVVNETSRMPSALVGSPMISCHLANRSVVGENMARGDRHGNREAKKPKKLKPKEIGPTSTLASTQKKALEATNLKKN